MILDGPYVLQEWLIIFLTTPGNTIKIRKPCQEHSTSELPFDIPGNQDRAQHVFRDNFKRGEL